MKLACITDPSTHPEFDTTVELYRRFATDPRIELTHISNASVLEHRFRGVLVRKALSYEEFLTLERASVRFVDLTDFDLVFCRSDKPLGDDYYERLAEFENQVRFVNSPSALREVSKRHFIEPFAKEFLPEFISTRSSAEAAAFLTKHKKIVFKSLDSYGGKGIWRATLEDGSVMVEHSGGEVTIFSDATEAARFVLGKNTGEMQLVRYLKNVNAGDKRVLVVGEKILGGYVRKGQGDGWINNITAGAKAEKAEVTESEQNVIQRTVGEFIKRGVHTLGYDFLMDDNGQWILSEVNAGNIGGYNRLEQLTGQPVIGELIKWLYDFSKR